MNHFDFFVSHDDEKVSFSFLSVFFNSETAGQTETIFLQKLTGEKRNSIINDTINNEKKIKKTADFQTRGSKKSNTFQYAT